MTVERNELAEAQARIRTEHQAALTSLRGELARALAVSEHQAASAAAKSAQRDDGAVKKLEAELAQVRAESKKALAEAQRLLDAAEREAINKELARDAALSSLHLQAQRASARSSFKLTNKRSRLHEKRRAPKDAPTPSLGRREGLRSFRGSAEGFPSGRR